MIASNIVLAFSLMFAVRTAVRFFIYPTKIENKDQKNVNREEDQTKPMSACENNALTSIYFHNPFKQDMWGNRKCLSLHSFSLGRCALSSLL
jgi:hypothetical protein